MVDMTSEFDEERLNDEWMRRAFEIVVVGLAERQRMGLGVNLDAVARRATEKLVAE
jgi:hypothetical protein